MLGDFVLKLGAAVGDDCEGAVGDNGHGYLPEVREPPSPSRSRRQSLVRRRAARRRLKTGSGHGRQKDGRHQVREACSTIPIIPAVAWFGDPATLVE
jgi:hypothetical protein